MQNGYFKWTQADGTYNVQRYNVFVRRVPYGTPLIKGDCQSDEMDIFIQRKKKRGTGCLRLSPRGGIWMQRACTVCKRASPRPSSSGSSTGSHHRQSSAFCKMDLKGGLVLSGNKSNEYSISADCRYCYTGFQSIVRDVQCDDDDDDDNG